MSKKLPQGWTEVKLGDIATYVNGKAFKPSEWSERGTPIVRIQNLTDENKPYNYYAKDDIPEKYIINNGDILISWSASLGVFEWNKGYAFLNQHIFKVVFDKIEINKKYFVYVVRDKLLEMERHTHGSTMKHITKGNFDKMPIALPPLEEQERIVSILERAESAIQKRKESNMLLDELVKSKFIEMFGDPVKNTKGWDMESLSEIGMLGRGVSKHRPRNSPELLGGDYPLIQTGDVANSGLYIKEYNATYSELGLKQSKLWNKGTLCITIAANIAKTGILDFDACFPDSVVGFIAGNKTNNIFMNYWFASFQKLLEEQAPESAQKNINLKILSELKVIMPPIELQNEFVDFIKQVDKLKFEMETSLKELENNFNSLMQRAFKGEV